MAFEDIQPCAQSLFSPLSVEDVVKIIYASFYCKPALSFGCAKDLLDNVLVPSTTTSIKGYLIFFINRQNTSNLVIVAG